MAAIADDAQLAELAELELLRRIVDGAPVVMFVVDPTGGIRWISGAVENLFGFPPDELVGTSILSHIDLEWNPIALESLAGVTERSGLQRPMLFRLIRKDGARVVAEVTANSRMDDPVVDGLLVYVRRWDERHLLDAVLESLAGGKSVDEVLRLLVEVIGAETLEADGVVFHGSAAGRFGASNAKPGLPVELGNDVGDPGTPWAQVRNADGPTGGLVGELPEPLASVAAAAGYLSWHAVPVFTAPDPQRRGKAPEVPGADACIVIWRRETEPLDHTRHFLLGNLMRLTELVLERDRAAASLQYAASHDSLTGLANRNRFFSVLQDELDGPPGPHVGVLYIDLDGFKPVNDRLGHGAGDEVLRTVARRMLDQVPDDDLVARLGGDEFTVLCRSVVDIDELGGLAKRLSDVIREPIAIGENQVSVGATIGIATSPPGACSIDVLVDAADAALYQAKSDDKGGYRFAVL